jgi:hypothetical protein
MSYCRNEAAARSNVLPSARRAQVVDKILLSIIRYGVEAGFTRVLIEIVHVCLSPHSHMNNRISPFADLAGRVVIVTGAAAGIGLGLSYAFAEQGCQLVLLPPEEWKRVLDVNLTGVFLCAQEAAREMIRAKGGVILNRLRIRSRGCSKSSRVLCDEGNCRHADKGLGN